MQMKIVLVISLICLIFIACDENLSSTEEPLLKPSNDSLIIQINNDTTIANFDGSIIQVHDVPSTLSFTIDDYLLFNPNDSYFRNLLIRSLYLTSHNKYDPDVWAKKFYEVNYDDTFYVYVDTGHYYCTIDKNDATVDLNIKIEEFDTIPSEFEPNDNFSNALHLPLNAIQKAYIGLFTNLLNDESIYSRNRYGWDRRDCYYFNSDSGSTYYLSIKSNRDESVIDIDSLFVADRQGNVSNCLSDLKIDDGITITATSTKTYVLFYVKEKPYSYKIQISDM